MRRHLITAAVVLGILQTVTAVFSLGSTIFIAVTELSGPSINLSTWWVVETVGSAAVRAAWTALVSYAAVQVFRSAAADRPTC
jgi:hypothetical protein